MEISDKEKEKYFRAISRHFLSFRGAPFFLSSKELDQIENWLQRGIPLRIVLEGIQSAYEDFRKKPVRKGRKLYLVFCHTKVLKCFKQYKDRKVGLTQKVDDKNNKRETVKKKVLLFLANIPAEIDYLKPTYFEAVKELSRGKFDEKKLEQYEKKIETLLLKHVSSEDMDKTKKSILREMKISETKELDRLNQVKIIKAKRDKYKIPYLSLYYY